MADSGALRARRSRAHKSGDHSLCRHDAVQRLAEVPAGDDARVDRARALNALAARLEAAHAADPGNSRLAAVLKDVLLALPAEAEPGDDPLADLRALAESVS